MIEIVLTQSYLRCWRDNMRHKFTKEQYDFIAKHIEGRTRKELLKKFNDHFEIELSLSQITAFLKNNKLRSGIDARFQKGHIPANKGKSIGGWKPTQFKKGHRPHNYLPVGTEVVNGDGYVEVKIGDPKTWRAKHLLIWEKENGPVPQGYAVIFGDGNRRNFDIDNLILVSRQQLALLNKRGLIKDDADLTRTGLIMVNISQKINERKRSNDN